MSHKIHVVKRKGRQSQFIAPTTWHADVYKTGLCIFFSLRGTGRRPHSVKIPLRSGLGPAASRCRGLQQCPIPNTTCCPANQPQPRTISTSFYFTPLRSSPSPCSGSGAKLKSGRHHTKLTPKGTKTTAASEYFPFLGSRSLQPSTNPFNLLTSNLLQRFYITNGRRLHQHIKLATASVANLCTSQILYFE